MLQPAGAGAGGVGDLRLPLPDRINIAKRLYELAEPSDPFAGPRCVSQILAGVAEPSDFGAARRP